MGNDKVAIWQRHSCNNYDVCVRALVYWEMPAKCPAISVSTYGSRKSQAYSLVVKIPSINIRDERISYIMVSHTIIIMREQVLHCYSKVGLKRSSWSINTRSGCQLYSNWNVISHWRHPDFIRLRSDSVQRDTILKSSKNLLDKNIWNTRNRHRDIKCLSARRLAMIRIGKGVCFESASCVCIVNINNFIAIWALR